jgi:hypothetical protein
MNVINRVPEFINEPRVGHDPTEVFADGGEYDRVFSPAALKTVS